MSKLYNSTAEWTDGKCGAGDDGGAAISPRSSPQLLIISDISPVARGAKLTGSGVSFQLDSPCSIVYSM